MLKHSIEKDDWVTVTEGPCVGRQGVVEEVLYPLGTMAVALEDSEDIGGGAVIPMEHLKKIDKADARG